MSYHLALRILQLSERRPKVGTFADCIAHSLAGDHPSAQLRRQIQSSAHRKFAASSLEDKLKELLAVDLNPVGQAIRLTASDTTFHRIWDFYNTTGNVVDKVAYRKVRQYETGSELVSHDGRMNEIAMHEKILECYQNALGFLLNRNQDNINRLNNARDSRVSIVARIYCTGNLIVELSEFFESAPQANVSDACLRLGISQRALERQMREFGITAVMLKRACMLAGATQEILWTTKSFSEISKRHGYANSAHMNHGISLATGGMSPSVVRGLAGN